MAEAQTQIEEQDDTADKAVEIGKQVGANTAISGKDADIPDYEVMEESEEDERVAKEKIPSVKTERKQLSNREKRDLRKKRIAEKFDEKDAIIEQQQQQIQELATRFNQVEGRLTNVDKQKIDENLNQATALFNVAEKNLESAFTEGDGLKHTKATKDMYAAQRSIEYWQGIKQQYTAPPAPKKIEVDPRITAKTQNWIERNSDWYNHAGGDEDSEIAKGISNALIKQGLNPASDEFWEELDDRLVDRGIIDSENDEQPAPKPVTRKRSSPPVAGGAARGDIAGKKQVTLPTEYIKLLKDGGYWDNVQTRNRMIKRYIDSKSQG